MGELFRSGPRARDRPFLWPLIVVSVALASLLRQEGTAAWDSLWSEDGSIFLDRALHAGVGSFGEAYNGYGHLLPRTLGYLASKLPLAWAPWIESVGSAVVVGLVSAFIWVASSAHLERRWLRLLAAVLAGLSPVAQAEAINNTANLQWFLTMALFWALLWVPERRFHQVAAGVVGLVAFGSAPLAVLLLPLLALRLVALRRRALDGLLAGSLLGLGYQLAITVGAPARTGNSAPLGGLAQTWVVRTVLAVVGDHPTRVLARDLGWAAVVLVGVVLLVAVIAPGSTRVLTLAGLCVGLSGLLFMVALARSAPVLPAHLHDLAHLDLLDCSRYAVVPVYLLTVAVLVSLDAAVGATSDRPLRVLLVLPAVALVGLGFVTDLRGGALRSTSPHWSTVLASARASCARGDRDVALHIAPVPTAVLELCSVIEAHD